MELSCPSASMSHRAPSRYLLKQHRLQELMLQDRVLFERNLLQVWLFLDVGGAFCGYPYDRSPTVSGRYWGTLQSNLESYPEEARKDCSQRDPVSKLTLKNEHVSPGKINERSVRATHRLGCSSFLGGMSYPLVITRSYIEASGY